MTEQLKITAEIVVNTYNQAAEVFEIYASDQLAMISRSQTGRQKRECKIRAEVWNEAAVELRNAAISETQRSAEQ